jgi:hypothetical protein
VECRPPRDNVSPEGERLRLVKRVLGMGVGERLVNRVRRDLGCVVMASKAWVVSAQGECGGTVRVESVMIDHRVEVRYEISVRAYTVD